MTGFNAGAVECRRAKAAMEAMERMEEIGTPSDVAYAKGAVISSMAACGAACSLAAKCLANSGDNPEISLFVNIFEGVSNIGSDCSAIVD